jgi:hypothetical protein
MADIKDYGKISDNVLVLQSRPQISEEVNRFDKHLTNTEINYINKIVHRNRDNNKKDKITDVKLGKIMENTANFFSNFMTEYQNKIYDTQLQFTDNNIENKSLDNLKIYLIAFIRYINENDNIIYLGIILIFMSIILYFFNITRT